MKWDKVVICDVWGPGKSHLAAPNGGDLKFQLVPRVMNASGTPADYVVQFSQGEAPDEWAGAIFTPMGKNAVTGISGLPDWDKSKPAVCKKYQDTINDATTNNLGNSGTARLESIIPNVTKDGTTLGFNYVRLFYVDNARNAPTKHLLVIKAVSASLPKGSVRALQDGAGHGPPS